MNNQQAAREWLCFHCDESFTDREAAAIHFGTHEHQRPACLIDAAEYRRMEAKEARYAEEDADCHRAMHRMAGEHQQALRRAEEAGYAKGLIDSGKCPCASKVADELRVTLFYADEIEPFIHTVAGACTVNVLQQIEAEANEYKEENFTKGAGDYEFSAHYFEGQFGEYGRCELAPGWELDLVSFREFYDRPTPPDSGEK